MAATKTLPETNVVPITTDSIVLSFETGPIAQIMESAPTQSVDVDIESYAIQAVLPSEEIVLGVTAPNMKSIAQVVGKAIGGMAFLYELYETDELKGYFILKVISLIGPLYPAPFAEKLQSISHRVNFYLEGHLVPAL